MEQKTDKKKSKWTLVNALLTITMPSTNTRTFDLNKLFSEIALEYEELPENLRFVMQYGVKQNLSDEIAGQKDSSDETKLDLMASRFEELVRGEIKTKREKADMVKTASVRENMVKMGFTEEQIAQALGK